MCQALAEELRQAQCALASHQRDSAARDAELAVAHQAHASLEHTRALAAEQLEQQQQALAEATRRVQALQGDIGRLEEDNRAMAAEHEKLLEQLHMAHKVWSTRHFVSILFFVFVQHTHNAHG